MNKLIALFLILFLKASTGQAQSTTLSSIEDSLQHLGTTILNDSLEDNRVKANYTFVKTLVSALKEKNSFSYPFEELKDIIAIKNSADNKFRIFTWFVMSDAGSFRYYGAIQINNPSKLELIPLFNNEEKILDPTHITLQPHEWLGAVYYDIVPVTTGVKNPYYLLLGWKGKNFTSSSKIIDVVSFEDGKAQFGLPVLESGLKSNDFNKRIIFNYTSSISMMLRYLKDEKLLVFDHLVPPNEKAKDQLDLYGPDLSYDAYRYKNGKWYFQENVKLKNLPDQSDDRFIDPTTITPSTEPIRKY